MMSKRTQLIVAGLFVAVIITPLIVGALGYTPKDIENNGVSDFPPLSDIGDPKFFDRLKEALVDQLPLRAEMVRAGALIDMALFNHNYNPDVKAGRDGWLFYRYEVYDRCADPVAQLAGGVKRLGDDLARLGIRFAFTIAPNKSAIYPEQLTPLLSLANKCPASRRAEARKLLPEQTAPYFVDLWAPLLAAKPTAPRRLYRIYDTHWSPTGAAIAAKAVVNHLRPGLWDDAALVISPTRQMAGDLNYLEGLDRSEPVNPVTTVRPGVIVKPAEPFPGIERSQVFKASSAGAYLIPGRTVIIHDSFFEWTTTMLPPYFEEIVFVDEHSRRSQQTINLIANSSTLIIALVERSVYGTGWYYDPEYRGRLDDAVQQNIALHRRF
jgi:acetyltransferase AlgX (SGNH hydrolase-like protein)